MSNRESQQLEPGLRALLADTAAAWGLTLNDHQLDQFGLYAHELRRWNEQVNLTAITDEAGIVVRHFLDSLWCARAWGEPPARLVDIGTGAGFPGLVLKLLRPTMQLTLAESVGKKTAFLQHMVGLLELTDVAVLTARAEELGRDPQHREQYDVATARAVADLRVLTEYCLPLVRVGGRLLAPKSAAVDEELAAAQAAIKQLGGQLLAVETVTLPGLEPRRMVIIEKVAPTPASYPRAVGVPGRRPL
ncbi:MAG: 16S rRNA (guanine(527)-N(7))-methyltransferase RsmG [Chloroflexaceae bacterium]|nr:16S rRNA (guanine(527)-N(7))-methyltransferase RsmG [Chloroflexaceae bacterium]